MKEKGFTLVELLGIIIIIGVLIIVIVTPIMANISNTGEQVNAVARRVIDAAIETHFDRNSNSYPRINGAVYFISVEELMDAELLDEVFINTHFRDGDYPIIRVTVRDGNLVTTYPDDSDFPTNLTNVGNLNVDARVWYSGFLWRVMSHNDRGTKLIMEHSITTLIYGANSGSAGTWYNDSHVRSWLNDYFLSRLQFSNLLIPYEWCVGNTATADDNCNDLVGLRNSAPTIEFTVQTRGNDFGFVRPVINMRKDTVTSSNPISIGTGVSAYIVGATALPNITGRPQLMNINISVGEYISGTGATPRWRVIEVGSEYLKLIQEHSTGTKPAIRFMSNSNFTMNSGDVGHTLNSLISNNTHHTNQIGIDRNLILSRAETQGGFYVNTGETHYRLTTLNRIQGISGAWIFLPKLGELLAVPGTLTMTRIDANRVHMINSSGVTPFSRDTDTTVYFPTMFITTNALVCGGNGTQGNPYRIAALNC